jgi:RHS repeat-associated protein
MTRVARFVFSCAVLTLMLTQSGAPRLLAQRQTSPPPARGQSVTLLPDGTFLLLGGDADPARATVYDPATRTERPVGRMLSPRSWHTATVMPDGTVVVVGGVDGKGEFVPTAEQFDPARAAFVSLDDVTFTPRARHTATLLTDSRLLIAGGDVAPGGLAAELWTSGDAASLPVGTNPTRIQRGARAELLPDGRVRFSDNAARDEVFDPASDSFAAAIGNESGDASRAGAVVASLPPNDASDVPVNARVALRFDQPLDVRSISPQTISLDASAGIVASAIVAAEEGRLVFITPSRPLSEATDYAVTIRGVRTASGREIAARRLTFRTAAREKEVSGSDLDIWTPNGPAWRSGADDSPWRRLQPLKAPTGVTALAGQVLTLDGRPLAGVTLSIDAHSADTDRTGRFLLKLGELSGGWHELVIEGSTANRGRRTFGRFEYGLSIVARRTNVLPFTIWMPVLDTANAVRIPSPADRETVVTTPRIPGLELHVPRGTVIKDEDGKVVREVSITPIPVDRPPFPLPNGVKVPIYFTIQPGGAYINVGSAAYGTKSSKSPRATGPSSRSDATGAWLVYPNYTHQPVGQRLPFWRYDPEKFGWHVYGKGTVTPNGRQIQPDPGVYLYEFTGAMIGFARNPPGEGPLGTPDGDPVDLATGLFVMEKTDLFLPDVLPLALTRTYRQNDNAVRPFGIGTQHPYDMWFDHEVGFQEIDLILPDGRAIHYVRTSPGTGLTDAVYEHTTTPTIFYGSKIVYGGNSIRWNLTLKDGTTFVFPVESPLESITDRFGNRITITRVGDPTGRISKITAPHGRSIEFTYDANDRITQAKDNLGRTVGYEYDTGGRLWKVTDVNGGVTEYTYDGSHRMLTIKDPRNIVYLENEYDTAGRVIKQTQADGGEYEFDYTLNGSGTITQTDVTNPRGFVRRVAFDSGGYPTSDTQALGETEEQTTSYSRLSGSHLLETTTDELGRVTRYQYDSKSNVTSVTRLYGTSDAKTTTFTYQPTYNLLASVTDPLNHTTSYAYDAQGRIQSITDALNHQTTFTTNEAGQVLTATNALNKTTTFTYDLEDLVSVTTPLGHTATRFLDVAGRLLRVTDARGATTKFEYSNSNELTKIVDPLGGQTVFTYDGNGNLLTLTDARSKTTTWTYDDMDRVETRTDPLSRDESFVYDLMGNLVTWTDRKGQVTKHEYDALNRRVLIGFGATGSPPTYDSTITTTYDAGDRPTDIVDSAAGTIERTYDLLDRLTEEETPEGTITYTYDGGNRRATMTVAGQTAVSYSFDNANRLTGVTRGTASVTLAYDNANKRTSLTLPNGIVVEYGYDDDSHLTGLTYKQGASTLGSLTYSYDPGGQRTMVEGTYARTGLPAALTSATYDDANQIATFGGTSFTYDDNGNLTNDGVRGYTWNARNQLASLTGSANGSFAYDGFGRRRAKTIGGTTTQFLYDGLNPVQELAGGTPTANLLTGVTVDEYFTRTDSSGVRNFLNDAQGSTLALADGSGSVQTEYTYEPFGATAVSGTSTASTFGFTGRESDGTGLQFSRARYYDARLQRFISEDPVAFRAGSTNLYAYVHNSPTRFTDPSGKWAFLVLPMAGCVGGAIGMGATRGWSGRKLALGCGLGALIGLAGAGLFAAEAAAAEGAAAQAGAAAEAAAAEAEATAAAEGVQVARSGLTYDEIGGLKDLFGRGQQGIADLLERLGSGQPVELPPGVTPESLQRYREIAQNAINAGIDNQGVQAARSQAIDILLSRLGIK